MFILLTVYKQNSSILSEQKINGKQVRKIDGIEGSLVNACDYSLRGMSKLNFETEVDGDGEKQLDRILNDVLFIADSNSN